MHFIIFVLSVLALLLYILRVGIKVIELIIIGLKDVAIFAVQFLFEAGLFILSSLIIYQVSSGDGWLILALVVILGMFATFISILFFAGKFILEVMANLFTGLCLFIANIIEAIYIKIDSGYKKVLASIFEKGGYRVEMIWRTIDEANE